jgi:hypothetical protein
MGQPVSPEVPDIVEWPVFLEVPDALNHGGSLGRVSGGLGRRAIRAGTTGMQGAQFVWVIGPFSSDAVAAQVDCHRPRTNACRNRRHGRSKPQ